MGLYEPGLAWLRLGVSFQILNFNWFRLHKLLLLLLVHLFGFFNVNCLLDPSNVFYMKECKSM